MIVAIIMRKQKKIGAIYARTIKDKMLLEMIEHMDAKTMMTVKFVLSNIVKSVTTVMDYWSLVAKRQKSPQDLD